MAVPTLLPAPRLTRDVEIQLAELTERRILNPARRAGHELTVIGPSRLPRREHVIVRTPKGPWLLVDHRDDPTTDPYRGKLPIPKDILTTLTKLDDAGACPDHIWIGHELPKQWKEGDNLTNLIPPPARLRQRDELLTKTIRTTLHLTGKALTAAAVAALSPLALIGTDPVLLGGVQHPTEPVVVWVELARWAWR